MSWVTIVDFPNYEVSDAGEVRNSKTGKVMKGGVKRNGYAQVKLSGHWSTVHRLVAQHFIENPENKPCVDHIDRNRVNNHLSNLRWVTQSENRQNTDYYGHVTSGHRHHIYTTSTDTFNVRFYRNGLLNKTFKTLEEAVAFRDQWMIDNPR